MNSTSDLNFKTVLELLQNFVTALFYQYFLFEALLKLFFNTKNIYPTLFVL